MSKIYTSADQLIGHTPLLELTHIENAENLEAKILAKLEYFNPAGSVKDRIARAMIDDAEATGKLKPGSVIIEPTSGNTGIGLASVAAARGYRIIIVMPETMSVERRQLMKAYGAELVLTDGAKGMKGAIAKADELAQEIPNSFVPGQFVNPANPDAHKRTTGPEIWEDTDGRVDIFVAGVGTGGTVTGVGEYLKSQNPNVKVVAVEPASSPVLSKGTAGAHKIQGIGAGFVPDVLNTKVYDEIIPVTNEDAFATGKQVGHKEGVMCLILAGKVGSNIASELGTMRVTQQIDALEIMGVNSANYLIMPKILALVTIMPFLVIFSSATGILGAYGTAYIGHILPPDDLTLGLQHAFNPWFVWMSIIKSLFFAFIISSVSSFFGYTVEGGSVEVGKASTDAVVSSSVLILFSDVFLTQLLS